MGGKKMKNHSPKPKIDRSIPPRCEDKQEKGTIKPFSHRGNKKAQYPTFILFTLIIIAVVIGLIMSWVISFGASKDCRICGFNKMTGYNIQNSSITKIECDKVHYIYREITENTLTDKWGYPYLNRTEQLNCRSWKDA
jgi:hypothetical protein